jgi:sporulation protein YlmC with PRC-barrel domain
MRSTLLGALLATSMIVPAFAQSVPNTNTAPAAPAPSATAPRTTTTAPATTTGMWRASKLMGLDVYNDQNEKLGDISEILVDKTGKIDGVVIGVGGFLGMGQHDIKVEMSKLRFVDEPVRSASGSTTTSTTGTGTNATGAANRATTTSSTSNDRKWYPDHAILSGATKDQLKSMPQFKYD